MSFVRSFLSDTSKEVLSLVMSRVCEIVASRMQSRHIPRRDDRQYLWRYYFEPESRDDKKISAFLHKFVGGDIDGEVHSHPWEWAVSLILANSYIETRYKRAGTKSVVQPDENGNRTVEVEHILFDQRSQHLLSPFSLNVIQHDDFHRVELVDPKKPCWTLFIHGPRRSTWGFASEETGLYREITVRTFDRPEQNPIHKD